MPARLTVSYTHRKNTTTIKRKKGEEEKRNIHFFSLFLCVYIIVKTVASATPSHPKKYYTLFFKYIKKYIYSIPLLQQCIFPSRKKSFNDRVYFYCPIANLGAGAMRWKSRRKRRKIYKHRKNTCAVP